MFFILSKLFAFLLIPFNWMLILGVIFVLIKNKKISKKIGIGIIIIGIIFSNPFIYRSVNFWWQPNPTILPNNFKSDVVILLGGFSGFDKFDTGYMGDNADRFIQAANLYHSHQVKYILISSGSGHLLFNEPSEASYVIKELVRNGVNKEAIILESQSRNTYENAVYSKRILDSLKLKEPFVLVTSAQHMPRSIAIFNKVGFKKIIPFPCDYK
ncbi:MAG: YdcF family protein, partial [Sphingobacteriia bacterium]